MKESITVGLLNRYAKELIERDEVLSQVWVEGEIDNCRYYEKSGYLYFSLRDKTASVSAVCFSRYVPNIRFVPKNGMAVVADCKVSLYERDGRFQLIVFNLYPKGKGTIREQAEEVRRRLEAEGLFAPSRKRPLPRSPKRIAVIASGGSAALQDILSVIGRRNPFVRVTVISSTVQGIAAVGQLMSAMQKVNADGSFDLCIIARGGGSSEDLWYFNSEELAREASRLRVPFISAVGHETDTTILDYVADLRAPTPSAAAELAVRDVAERCERARAQFALCLPQLKSRMNLLENTLLQKKADLKRAQNNLLADRGRRLDSREALARALDPMNVLLRGYALATAGGIPVMSTAALREAGHFTLQLHDGQTSCRTLDE